MTPSRLPTAVATALVFAVVPATAASFDDGFGTAGDVAGLYTGAEEASPEAAAGVDAFAFTSGSSFTLDPASSRVDLDLKKPGGFNSLLLARSLDAANVYDLNAGISLTLNASGLPVLPFNNRRNPVLFGVLGGEFNPDVTVAVQNVNNSGANVSVSLGGNVFLPGAEVSQPVRPGIPNNQDYTLNIDSDSYSLLRGASVLVADTAHGQTFSSLGGVTPFFGASAVFGTNGTALSVNRFAGEGVTFIPEPASATLALAGLGLLAARRRRGR